MMRAPAVAGRFYPDNAEELRAEVDTARGPRRTHGNLGGAGPGARTDHRLAGVGDARLGDRHFEACARAVLEFLALVVEELKRAPQGALLRAELGLGQDEVPIRFFDSQDRSHVDVGEVGVGRER